MVFPSASRIPMLRASTWTAPYDREGEGGEERKMAFYQQRRVVHSSYMPKMLSHTAKMRADPGYLDEQESD